MSIKNKLKSGRRVAIALLFATLAACNGGSKNNNPAASVAISGTVSAPGGSLAFAGPTWSDRMLAWLGAAPAHAAMSGTLPVGGATVSLIQIDESGAQVGSPLATATTATDGTYTLKAPSGFTPAANYVVRAKGSTGTLDAIVTDTSAAVDVDPSTEACKLAVLASVAASPAATLAALRLDAIGDLAAQIVDKLQDVDLTSATTASQVASAIRAAILSDEELYNDIMSLAQSGIIKGRVTDANGTGLAHIKIVALDYNNWVKRAQTHTDANGDYTLHVPPSPAQGYLVGAFNLTTASTAASGWYRTSGIGTSPWQGDRVTVAAASAATADMQLADGARISGSVVTGGTPLPLPGIRITMRDVASRVPVVWTHTRLDGTYTLNVPVGGAGAILAADNFTLQPYASGVYNGPAAGGTTTAGGAIGADRGTLLAPAAGATLSANFTLASGQLVAGIVTVGPLATSAPAPRAVLRVFDSTGDFVAGRRSNLLGLYHFWLQPNATAGTAYVVRARGQSLAADLSTGKATDNFIATVNTRTLTLTSDGTTPVPQVKVQVYDATTAATSPASAYEGFEVSRGDGSTTLYTTSSTSTGKNLVFKVDGPQAGIGSSVYSGSLSLGAGTAVVFDGTNLGTVTLPAGSTLSGTVTVTTTGLPAAPGNYVIQVYSGAVSAGSFFAVARSQSGGRYALNLPAGTYNVRACQAGTTTCSSPASVTVAPPATPAALDFTM